MRAFRRPSWRESSLAALLALSAGCAAVSPRAPSPVPAPPASAPLPHAPALRAFPPQAGFEGLPPRPVRVLLEERRDAVAFEGETIRAWDAAGRPVAEEAGRAVVAPAGEKIRWGARVLFDSPLDVSGSPVLRIAGGGAYGRLRLVARKGALLLIAVVPLEDYVAGVVSREAAPSFHGEALKAIAVAARTYARGAAARPRDPEYDVAGSVNDQVFDAGSTAAEPFAEAARRTRGEILVFRGAPARAVYHSTCGGATESAKDAWGNDVPYLRSVACDDCRHSPAWRWEYRMSAREGRRIARVFGVGSPGPIAISVASRTASGRASRIRIAAGRVEREAPAAAFRREAGYARVRSLKMEVVPLREGWLFLGEGYGHGVGMCQWGADGMAAKGGTYRQILARYYPGTEVAGGRP